jgi:hypothetical protein
MVRSKHDHASMIVRDGPTLNTPMKKLLTGIAIGAVAASTLIGLGYVLVSSSDSDLPNIPQDTGQSRRGSGIVDMICELQLDLDGQLALGINANEPRRIALAQVDFDKQSGWYQGTIAISEGRAGSLTIKGPKLIVTRPAMFQRFGTMIKQEEFSIDRSTGAFVQTLTVGDGKVIPLIRGTCAKVDKPPF